MKQPNLVISAVIGVIGLAVGFFGGTAYQSTQKPNFQNLTQEQRQQMFGQFRNGAGGGGRNGGAAGTFANGQILNKDEKSITVKMRDGSTKLIFLAPSTEINKPAPIKATDLNVNDQVSVSGTANSDGSLTASTIQVRPPMPVAPDANPTPSAK